MRELSKTIKNYSKTGRLPDTELERQHVALAFAAVLDEVPKSEFSGLHWEDFFTLQYLQTGIPSGNLLHSY